MSTMTIIFLCALFALGPPLATLILALLIGGLINVARHAIKSAVHHVDDHWPVDAHGAT